MFRRVGLFLLTNILIVVTISFLLRILGVQPYLTSSGIDYQNLMIFCLVWGMAGSFISLAISRKMAKWMMGVQLVDERSAGVEGWLVQTVHQLARQANLPKMPEVGIYQSPEVNAFATGPSKSRSLVAVSTGLLQTMDKNQIHGVLGHEIAHIQNGDMVTMTLLQGVVNAFVMFFARAIAFAVSQNVKDENRAMVNMLVVIGLEILLGLLGVMVVAWFSRKREFIADAGGARLSGRENMTSALVGLQRLYNPIVDQEAKEHPALAAYKISGGRSGGLRALFATHPPLEERIARLQAGR